MPLAHDGLHMHMLDDHVHLTAAELPDSVILTGTGAPIVRSRGSCMQAENTENARGCSTWLIEWWLQPTHNVVVPPGVYGVNAA